MLIDSMESDACYVIIRLFVLYIDQCGLHIIIRPQIDNTVVFSNIFFLLFLFFYILYRTNGSYIQIRRDKISKNRFNVFFLLFRFFFSRFTQRVLIYHIVLWYYFLHGYRGLTTRPRRNIDFHFARYWIIQY